jgi:hypothetical protein
VSDASRAAALPESAQESGELRRRHRHQKRSPDGQLEESDDAPQASANAPPPGKAGPPGTIVVGTTQGWALVFEGSRKLGTTPLKLELPSGPHNLTVRPYGEGSARRIPVEIKPGEITKLRVEL